MPTLVSINIGFVTNSSSAINHFPRELLEHPAVAAFVAQMGIEEGFVGDDLWYRNRCTTVAVTKEQKQKVVERLAEINDGEEKEYHITPPPVNTESDEVLIIYGDEYDSVAANLAQLMSVAALEMGVSYSSDQYN